MTSTMAPEARNDTGAQTVIGRATTMVADVGAIVADDAPAALAASRGMAERVFANLGGRSDGSPRWARSSRPA